MNVIKNHLAKTYCSRVLCGNDYPELAFVLLIWLLHSVAAGTFIWYFGTDIPRLDDWGFVTPLAEGVPLTWEWLWHKAAEHRLPAQKLMMYLAWHATGGNLRVGMLCGFIPLAMIVGALVLAIRKLRGRAYYTDAFLPLLLLNMDHMGVFAWFTTMATPWFAALTCSLVVIFASPKFVATLPGAAIAAICAISLSLQGASGLTSAIPFALGLGIIAAIAIRKKSSGDVRAAIVLATGAVCVFFVVLVVVASFDANDLQDTGERSLYSVLVTAVEFLSMSMGQGARRAWPLSGIAIIVVLVCTLGLLIYQISKSSFWERIRAVLLILALMAPCLTALAVGIGRPRQGALLDRYALISAPLLVATYVAWICYAPPRLSRCVQMLFFTSMCALSLYYASESYREMKTLRANSTALVKDIYSGKCLTELVARHDRLWVGDEKRFRRGLTALRYGGISPFDLIRDDPPIEAVRVETSALKVYKMTPRDDVWRGMGRDSQLIVMFEKPAHVLAVRCAYVLETRRNATLWETTWLRANGDNLFSSLVREEALINFNSARHREREVHTVWIDEEINGFGFSPSAEPCEFRLLTLEVLIRAGEPKPQIR